MSQISSSLLKKAFETRQHVFLFISIAYYDNFAQACQGMKVYILFFRQESDKRLFACIKDFLLFLIFFAFPFSLFLIFFAAVIDLNWARFQFKNFWESVIMTGNFYHGVVTCSRSKFELKFQSILCISQAPLSQSLWSGYHWKQFFLLLKLSIDDANFGQRWWYQKWIKGQILSQWAQALEVKGWSRISINTQQ